MLSLSIKWPPRRNDWCKNPLMIQKVLDSHTVRQFYALLECSARIVITCHVRPDGDAMGSSLGLWHLLHSLGKDAKVVTPDTPPRQLSFMPGIREVVPYTRYEEYASRLMREADLIVCCDFNGSARLDALGPLLEASKARKVMIDHHLAPSDFADIRFSNPEMSSASELMFRIVAAMGLYTAVNTDCATCLSTGIITDTKNMSVNCSNPELYLIMLELAKKGVDAAMIVKKALHTKRYEGIKLHAYALANNYRFYHKHGAALVWLTRKDLERFDYEKGDTEGLVDQAGEAAGVIYTIFLREDNDCIKVSTRSVGNFPVNKICEQYFNGGGHLQAAGGKYFGTMDECLKLCEKIMDEFYRYLPAAGNDQHEKSDEK